MFAMANVFGGLGLVVGVAFGFAGCKREPARITPVASTPAPAVAIESGKLSGTVVETMDAGGYTYAQLERGNTRIWVAGPITKLTVGTALDRLDGAPMSSFHSDTLDRTFDLIYFVNSYGDATPVAASDDSISGVVVETMNSGGYTYARLEHAGTQVWVAGPETKLAIGARLDAMTGSLMTGFHSDSLKRTFDRIYFVNAYALTKAAPAAPNEKLAVASGGKTIAEVIAGKDALAGTSIAVRGKVVKLNDGIMDRNWIHLSDGGTADLLVTTHDTTKLGNIVVARGVVATHQDFGAGYKYDVMIENATLASE
jgi:hypothetical protein